MKNFSLIGLVLTCALMNSNAQVLFNETFDFIPGTTSGGAGTYNFAPGFLLRNVDNLNPAGSVSYVNEAWERREDFIINPADSAAFSTSWYVPAGQSNDWMWTPLIGPLPQNVKLSWNALAPDAAYPDGYEVRIMVAPSVPTGGNGLIGNQITNSTVLFSTAAENSTWTSRSVSLNPYAGQSVYIGFRNNSNDQFLLVVDDIKVEVLVDFDAQLLSVNSLSEYTQIPASQVAPINFEGTLKNLGVQALSNVTLTANVYDQTQTLVHTASSSPIASLAPMATSSLTIPAWTPPSVAQNYTVKLFVDANEADQVSANDTITRTITITETTYARDNGIITGSLGIGAGNGGYLGQDFIINNTARISEVGVYYTRGYTGKRMGVAIWNMTANVPDQIVALTDTLIYPDDSADYYIMPINQGPFELTPGRYAITAIEFDSTLALAQTNEIFTTGRTWVDWPTSPIAGWANNENFGANFSKPYLIRPTILPTCPANLVTSSTVNDAACGNADGSIELIVGGGNYTFSWSDGQTSATASNLSAAQYSVTVTNTDLICTQVYNYTVNNQNGPTLVTISGSDVDCFGDEGTANVEVTGGTAPYTYLWSNGENTTSITDVAGSYSVVVTDDNGCILTAGPVEITSPAELAASGSFTPESCPGCADGTASASVSGGVEPYSYSWSPSGGNASQASGLTGGSYTVSITDDNGCETEVTITVTTNASITGSETTENNHINTFPNPSNGVFVFTSDILHTGDALVEVLDISGKLVYSKNITMNNSLSNTTVYLEYAAAGTYILRFTAGNNKFFRKLIIK
jgi:hypothetical protein